MLDAESFKRRLTISQLAMTGWLAETTLTGFLAETCRIIQAYCDQEILPNEQTPSANFFRFPILPVINRHINVQLPPAEWRDQQKQLLKELSAQLQKAEQDPKRVS